jgi:hypothetical protein
VPTRDDVFLGADRAPRLTRCAVLFLDLLGVRAMNRGSDADVRARLVALDDAIGGMYRHYVGPDAPFPSAFFSDTLVLAAPVVDDDATAVTELLFDAARLQMDLLTKDFFVRGGLTVDLFHIREGLIFGPALVEAYELESRHAVHPRVVLSKEAAAVVDPATTQLLRDDDGWAFVNYLDPLLEALDDPVPLLQAHRGHVVDRLRRHRDEKGVWEKYRWVAEYHNAFVAMSGLEREDLLVPAATMTWRFARFP